MFRLLVSAGGTGGGVYPALATIADLGSRADVLWLGGHGGMESDLVRRAGIAFESVAAAGVHGVGLGALPGNLVALARGTRQAGRVIRRFQPQALLLTGGYVGIPAAVAGRRVPSVLYVPDLEPALAARVMARFADVVAVSADESRRFYPAGKRLEVTGYPTRPGLASVARPEARRALALPTEAPVVLVLGGSLGARSINRAVWEGLSAITERAYVVHLTGAAGLAEAEAAGRSLPPPMRDRYRPFAYLHDEIGDAYAAADLGVGRAGASSLGEPPLFGLPMVLVPYPHAWRYQQVNADYLVRRGAAVVVDDADLGADLIPTVLSLLSDPGRLAAMSTAARRQASPGAARRLAELVEAAATGARP